MKRFKFWRRWLMVKELRRASATVSRARAYATLLAKCLNRLDELGMDVDMPELNERSHRVFEIVDRETSKTLAAVEEWPLLCEPWAVER